MSYLVFIFFILLVGGLVLLASNPSPYYGAIALVVVASVGCGLLVWLGSSFVSLILFLIYLGGMLVVFAYSVALASEPYPETWGSWAVGGYFTGYFIFVLMLWGVLGVVWSRGLFGLTIGHAFGLFLVRIDFVGVSLLYSDGGWDLLVSGWGLLLTLFVVLELTRGLARGSLRLV